MKFNIGDQVWRATFESTVNYVACPDCSGTGRLRVIFHDETIVSIECRNCALGYDPPTGRIAVYDRVPEVSLVTIVGIDASGKEIEYRTFASERTAAWILKEKEIFLTQEEAQAYAAKLSAELDEEDRRRIAEKEKDTRSWAWNASYHRQRIKQAKKDITYHSAKLAVAAIKSKEEKVKA